MEETVHADFAAVGEEGDGGEAGDRGLLFKQIVQYNL